MSQWPATKARRILAALLRIGWSIKRETGGSHRRRWSGKDGLIMFAGFP